MSTLVCTSKLKCTLTQTHITFYKSQNWNYMWEGEGYEFGAGCIGGEPMGFYIIILELDGNREMISLVSGAWRKQNDGQKLFIYTERYHQSLISTDYINTGANIFQSWQKRPESSTEAYESVQEKSISTFCTFLALYGGLQSCGICC